MSEVTYTGFRVIEFGTSCQTSLSEQSKLRDDKFVNLYTTVNFVRLILQINWACLLGDEMHFRLDDVQSYRRSLSHGLQSCLGRRKRSGSYCEGWLLPRRIKCCDKELQG
jgi:hypothetical protein